MNESHATQPCKRFDWQMPLSLERYDRSPQLSEAEREALAWVRDRPRVQGRSLIPRNHPLAQRLARLIRPLQDVYALKQSTPDGCSLYLHWMCLQMLQMNKPFWGWSKDI